MRKTLSYFLERFSKIHHHRLNRSFQ